MDRAFELLQEIADVVQAKPGTKRTQISRLDAKGLAGPLTFLRMEPEAKVLVHDVASARRVVAWVPRRRKQTYVAA